MMAFGIYFYRNDGTVEEADWTFVTDNYGGIEVGYSNAPTFADIDADGDLDLFVSLNVPFWEQRLTFINFYRNDGTVEEADWTFVTDKYGGIEVGLRSMPAFADIDADGDLDLFIGYRDYNPQNPPVGLYFYRNDGTAEEPSWTFVTDNYAGIDVGDFSAPTFADIDNDGDLDLFIGCSNYLYPYGWYSCGLHFYKNDGTAEEPAWVFVTDEYAGYGPGCSECDIKERVFGIPTFADIDADGDLDLFVGHEHGSIYFYRNDGTAEEPAWVFVTDEYAEVDVGGYSAPVFTDIDNDGDLDLFIGQYGDNPFTNWLGGTIYFYRNDGTVEETNWTFVTNNYAGIDLREESYSAPTFADIDNDGDLDLFVGNDHGGLYFYQRSGPPVIEPIEDIEVREGELITITVQASDPDGDELTYSIDDERFVQVEENVFEWQTGCGDAGNYTVKVTASDGYLTDEEEVNINVEASSCCDGSNANVTVIDNIEYCMQTDKAVYNLGEDVEMLYRVTNFRDEDVTFSFSAYPDFNFWVERDGMNIWTAVHGGWGVWVSWELSPGESKEFPHMWDMTCDDWACSVEPGEYTMIGGLYTCFASCDDYKHQNCYYYSEVPVQIEII